MIKLDRSRQLKALIYNSIRDGMTTTIILFYMSHLLDTYNILNDSVLYITFPILTILYR